jgi:Complex I intermediate-associated protein 30 (CIA30)
VDAADSDRKRYTVTLKDELPEARSDGRNASGVSWEAVFSIGEEGEEREVEKLYFPWEVFRPTYRGRELLDVKPLRKGNVKQISLLMRR